MSHNRKGIYSTEFWTTVASMIVMSCVLFGIVPHADADAVTDSVVKVVIAAFNMLQVMQYVKSRSQVKAAQAAVSCPTCGSLLPDCTSCTPKT